MDKILSEYQDNYFIQLKLRVYLNDLIYRPVRSFTRYNWISLRYFKDNDTFKKFKAKNLQYEKIDKKLFIDMDKVLKRFHGIKK